MSSALRGIPASRPPPRHAAQRAGKVVMSHRIAFGRPHYELRAPLKTNEEFTRQLIIC